MIPQLPVHVTYLSSVEMAAIWESPMFSIDLGLLEYAWYSMNTSICRCSPRVPSEIHRKHKLAYFSVHLPGQYVLLESHDEQNGNLN